MNKCVNCKHCIYRENEKAYCGQCGEDIEEQNEACEAYKEVEKID